MMILNLDHTTTGEVIFKTAISPREREIISSEKFEIILIPKDKHDKDHIDTERLIFEITSYFNVSLTDIMVKKRTKNLVNVRMFICKYFRTLTRLSLSEIGFLIGRDHASILHMLKRFDSEMYYPDAQKIKSDLDMRLIKAGLIKRPK